MPASAPTLAYSVRRSVACRADLEHIFDYLLRTYQDLGDPLGKAFERAVHRIAGIEAGMDQLGHKVASRAWVRKLIALFP